MICLFVVFAALTSGVLGGSLCPPRENIYPCTCFNTRVGKNIYHTIVSCYRLSSTQSFATIFPFLKTLKIDQFYLFDSFWDAHMLGEEHNKVLPKNWLTTLKIKEIEIVDSTLAACFACSPMLICSNSVTTKFIVSNSTDAEKICTLCETGKGNKYSWTGCMKKLQSFHFINNQITQIGLDLFPMAMKDLVVLNVSRNLITRVDPAVFKNLKKLKSLDLSHNQIEKLDGTFAAEINLEFLDVSWNVIKTIGPQFFKHLPQLKTLIAEANEIVELKEEDWKGASSTLKFIDLRENPIHCDCNIKWINGTFHINVVLQGTCATPEDYENSLLRKASRLLIERCDEEGNIGTR
ncbi:Leucine-rich repeat neuronal protein 2, partial [Stegodyphus mimosarum]